LTWLRLSTRPLEELVALPSPPRGKGGEGRGRNGEGIAPSEIINTPLGGEGKEGKEGMF